MHLVVLIRTLAGCVENTRQLTACTGALAIALLAAGCYGRANQEKPAEEKVEEGIPVEVTTIQRGSIQEIVKASHYLEAEEEVKVLARTANLAGELLVEEGDPVKKDQILLRLESDTQRTQLAKARSQFEKASLEFGREQSLYEQKLISDQAFADAKFELRQLELSLEEAQRQLDYTEVRAPISGTIVRRMVKVGDNVSVGQHLFDIVNFDSLVAPVYLSDKILPRIEVGQSARLTPVALPGKSFQGYIKRIAPIVDAKTGTIKVTVGLKELGPLRPGMYVDAEIVLADRPDAILIPKRAVVYDSDQMYVFRLITGRRVERLLVVPRIDSGDLIEPDDGFAVGDQIVVAGQTGLKDGALVRLPGDPEPPKKEPEDK